MSSQETRTFRAENLDEALAEVRKQFGPEAIVVRQREGIVGGVGGFFGKRCVEVDVECPPPLQPQFPPKASALPARAVTSAYTAEHSFADAGGDDDPGDLFRSLLDESSVFASTLADAIERTPADEEPEPVFEPIVVDEVSTGRHLALPAQEAPAREPVHAPARRAPVAAVEPELRLNPARALTHAGIEDRLAESIVAEAKAELRAFDWDEPFVNQVREVLASRIQTRRFSSDARRTMIAVVGAPGSGKTVAAAKLCHVHVAMGRRVSALSLEPVRAAMELGNLTAELDVELLTADHPGMIDVAREKLEPADVVIVDTPGITSCDESGWSRLAALLRPLEPNETHLLLPGWLDPPDVDDFIGIGSERLGVDRLLLTHLQESPGAGPAVSGSIRAGIPISATATAERLVPAAAHRLAQCILP